MLLLVDRVFSSTNMRELGIDTFLLLYSLLIKKKLKIKLMAAEKKDGGSNLFRPFEPLNVDRHIFVCFVLQVGEL